MILGSYISPGDPAWTLDPSPLGIPLYFCYRYLRVLKFTNHIEALSLACPRKRTKNMNKDAELQDIKVPVRWGLPYGLQSPMLPMNRPTEEGP